MLPHFEVMEGVITKDTFDALYSDVPRGSAPPQPPRTLQEVLQELVAEEPTYESEDDSSEPELPVAAWAVDGSVTTGLPSDHVRRPHVTVSSEEWERIVRIIHALAFSSRSAFALPLFGFVR